MPKYKIIFDREACIGALPCVEDAPDFWKMSPDGKVDLLGGIKTAKNIFELEFDEKDLQVNMQAAKDCPVNCIHIINLETGEQLI